MYELKFYRQFFQLRTQRIQNFNLFDQEVVTSSILWEHGVF